MYSRIPTWYLVLHHTLRYLILPDCKQHECRVKVTEDLKIEETKTSGSEAAISYSTPSSDGSHTFHTLRLFCFRPSWFEDPQNTKSKVSDIMNNLQLDKRKNLRYNVDEITKKKQSTLSNVILSITILSNILNRDKRSLWEDISYTGWPYSHGYQSIHFSHTSRNAARHNRLPVRPPQEYKSFSLFPLLSLNSFSLFLSSCFPSPCTFPRVTAPPLSLSHFYSNSLGSSSGSGRASTPSSPVTDALLLSTRPLFVLLLPHVFHKFWILFSPLRVCCRFVSLSPYIVPAL